MTLMVYSEGGGRRSRGWYLSNCSGGSSGVSGGGWFVLFMATSLARSFSGAEGNYLCCSVLVVTA